jgi:hypothetical protein
MPIWLPGLASLDEGHEAIAPQRMHNIASYVAPLESKKGPIESSGHPLSLRNIPEQPLDPGWPSPVLQGAVHLSSLGQPLTPGRPRVPGFVRP